VTIQAQILEVLRTALREFNTSLVLITHNLSLVAELADRVDGVVCLGAVIRGETAHFDYVASEAARGTLSRLAAVSQAVA